MPAPDLDTLRNKKIQCIKQLREETGVGLKEAKEACDKHCREADSPTANPELIWARMTAAAKGETAPVTLMPPPPLIQPANLREAVRVEADNAHQMGHPEIALRLYKALLDYPDNATYTIE